MFKNSNEIDKSLPLALESGKIVLSKETISLPVSYRRLEEARPYLKDEDAVFSSDYIYAMHRGVCFREDKDLFEKYGLRYDVTQILPGFLGNEFIKTIGHCHKDSSSEVYEVLSGEAIFLFQEVNFGKDVYLIEAEEGQKVVIPPGYGHITVNPGDSPLILANIVFSRMEADYDFFKNNRGAGYYIVKPGTGSREIKVNNRVSAVKNENYPDIGELKVFRPKEIKELGVSFSKPLYQSFTSNPESFDFVENPGKYEGMLTPDNLYAK